MLLVDARRLTGPNLLARRPQVVVELTFEASDRVDLSKVHRDPTHVHDKQDSDAELLDRVRETYLAEMKRMLVALGCEPRIEPVLVRPHRGGAVIAFAAPSLDLMLPYTEMAEWAALSACEIIGGRAALSLDRRDTLENDTGKRTEIATMLKTDRNPKLVAIADEASRRDLPFLWDDTEVTVGAGERSLTWPREALPKATDVPWNDLGSIPIALITGTNGKTTSSRLLAHIARAAGHRVGCSSSDAIMVGTEVIDAGDWTGPAAARIVLRRKDVDFAVLETARGGILRRGLAIDHCDAALITNVSEDHTGGYGIDDLDAMTRVKAVVADAVRASKRKHAGQAERVPFVGWGLGGVVLNAHDPRLVALDVAADVIVIFFADLERNDDPAARAVIAKHQSAGKPVVFTAHGDIWSGSGDAIRTIVHVADIPITFDGAARYNVENVLGVIGMAHALGLPNDVTTRALRSFKPSDNPRRGEVIERAGVRVLLDFGHNPEGVRAVMKLATSLREPTGRLNIVAGSAGDRSDHEIDEMSAAIVGANPHRILLRDLGDYLRGRAPGEMPNLFRRALIGKGAASSSIAIVSSEVEALRQVFEGAKPGDFIVVLVHLDHEAVHEFLASI